MKASTILSGILAVLIYAVVSDAQVFTFGGRYATGDTADAIVAADFDNDSDIDIAVGHRHSSFICVYENDGDANFTLTGQVASYELSEMFSADLNGDGYNDLMGGSQYFFNNCDGTFYLAFEDTLGGAKDICADDFNGDDIVDIVYAEDWINTGIFVFWGLGGGNFSDRDTLLLGNFNSELLSADFDNDGNPDLLYRNADGSFTLLNDGSGNFTSVAIDGLAMHDLETADLNSDGIMDIVGIGQYSCVGVPRYMLGTGDGHFDPIHTAYDITGLLSTNTVCPADFNYDGYVDLAICGDTTLVFCGYNDGLLDFESLIDELEYGYTGALSLAAADLNGDGDTDMIVTNSDDSLTIVLSLASAHSNRILIPDDLPSIQEGVDYAWNLDTIIVQPGTYTELIDFGGKSLVLASKYLLTGDYSFINSTIIDGGGAGSVLTFNDGEDSRAKVIGFTIQNGDSPSLGGGIYCYDVASPTIMFNIIKNNNAVASAGGILTGIGAPIIKNNIITGNTCGTWGGGMFLASSYAHIINNTIYGNTAGDDGGGMCFNSATTTVQNNIVRGNSATSEGDQIAYFGSDPPVLTYCDVQGGYAGEGNIDSDPLFRDSTAGDFHLNAIACGDYVDSPCIDAGDPVISDFLLDCAWGLGASRSDMGAYGGGEVVTVGIEELIEELPRSISLLQNYPNPFNARTTISYILNSSRAVTIEIYDLLGRHVETINTGMRPAGRHHVTWNAENHPSGVYFYRIQAGDHSESKKMTLLK